MKSRLVLVLVVCLQGFTCNDGGEVPDAPLEQAAGEAPQQAPARRRARVTPAPPVAPAPGGTATYEDLLALLHLADVYDPAGLFIDFGTAARLKYTIGNWNSGWQGESREGGASVSTFGKTARLYLPAASKQPMQIRMRAKPYTTGALIVYVNGKTAGEARISRGDGFREIVIPISKADVRAGENAIMLRATKTAQVRGKARSLAMDWLLFEPSSAPGTATPRPVAVEQASVGGVGRRAIVLAPSAEVDWFVEVPEDGTLVFGSGLGSFSAPASALRVRAPWRCRSAATSPPVRPRGALALQISSDESAGSTKRMDARAAWDDEQVSLKELAGEIVRVRFRNDGASVTERATSR
jgi:hypothetical protein